MARSLSIAARARPMPDPDSTRALQADVAHLAAIDRPRPRRASAEAAEWIAARLREPGCARQRRGGARARQATGGRSGVLERGRRAGRLARARRPRGVVGGVAAAFAAAAICGRHHRRRAVVPPPLPAQAPTTWNVVAETGDPRRRRARSSFVAHHDAAHAACMFHPALHAAASTDVARACWSAPTRSPPLMGRCSAARCWSRSARRRGRRAPRRGRHACSRSARPRRWPRSARADVVPGANDNLTGVATLLGLAPAGCASEPRRRALRVLLRLDRLGGGLHGGHAGLRAAGTSPRCRRSARTSSASTRSARRSSC